MIDEKKNQKQDDEEQQKSSEVQSEQEYKPASTESKQESNYVEKTQQVLNKDSIQPSSNQPNQVTKQREDSIDNSLRLLSKIDKFIEYIKNSEYVKNFEEVIYDKNGVDTGERRINKSDIIANVLLGNRLGLTPMESIVQGKRLNRQGYQKIQLGTQLGLSPIASLDSIHIISTSAGESAEPGIHVLSKVLLENGIDFEFTKNYEHEKVYIDNNNNKYEDRRVKNDDKFYIVNKSLKSITKEDISEIKENKREDQTAIFFAGFTRYSEILVKRNGMTDYVTSYSLVDATNAGLYPGYDSQGNEIKGKSVWIRNTADMLESKLLRLAARRRAADKLGGNPIYGEEEFA